jgi:hypothetical protein
MSVDRGTVNYSAPEVLRGATDYTVGPVLDMLSRTVAKWSDAVCHDPPQVSLGKYVS